MEQTKSINMVQTDDQRTNKARPRPGPNELGEARCNPGSERRPQDSLLTKDRVALTLKTAGTKKETNEKKKKKKKKTAEVCDCFHVLSWLHGLHRSCNLLMQKEILTSSHGLRSEVWKQVQTRFMCLDIRSQSSFIGNRNEPSTELASRILTIRSCAHDYSKDTGIHMASFSTNY